MTLRERSSAMKSLYLIYWFTCATVCLAVTQDVVEKLPKCRHAETDCAIKLMSQMLTFHDPYQIDKISFTQNGNGAVGIKFKYENATAIGLSKAVVSQVNGFTKNPDKMKLEVKFHVPKISVVGPYEALRKVIVFTIKGNGQANITFINQNVTLRMLTKKITKGDGKDYMQIDKVKMDFEVERLICYFTNLFNGDNVLEQHFNNFFNENWRDILGEIKPVVSQALGKVYMNSINKFVANIPYNEIFID